jgi:hypothetical protein
MMLTTVVVPMHRRFLRARRWVVQDAYTQFKETEEWRKANELEVLYDTIDVKAYEETRRLVRHLRIASPDDLADLGDYSILNGQDGETRGLSPSGGGFNLVR